MAVQSGCKHIFITRNVCCVWTANVVEKLNSSKNVTYVVVSFNLFLNFHLTRSHGFEEPRCYPAQINACKMSYLICDKSVVIKNLNSLDILSSPHPLPPHLVNPTAYQASGVQNQSDK